MAREFTRCVVTVEGEEIGHPSITRFAKDNADYVATADVERLQQGYTIHGGGGASMYWEAQPTHPVDL